VASSDAVSAFGFLGVEVEAGLEAGESVFAAFG
jgi:hypothetical protein